MSLLKKIAAEKQQQIRDNSLNASSLILNNIVWLLLVLSIVIMGLFQPIFFSSVILSNILVQATVLGILTAGLSFTILLGDIDLSVVGNMAFSAALGTLAMKAGLPWGLAVVMIILIGLIFGFINGWLIAKLKAVALIETLAMNMILTGGVIAVTKGRSIVGLSDSYKWAGQGRIFGVPFLPIIFIVVYIILYIVWTRTALGRSLYAVGGNEKSAYVSGIKVDNIRIAAFTVSGMLAGLSGYLLSGYMGAVTSTFGTEYTMNSIAASVIGGVSLSGGRGSIPGILGGVLLLTVIQVGLQVLGISSYYVQMAGGLMIFIAVLIDAIRVRIQG
ncbi:ABC transporter permease [Halocella sp. SP3-1]|uniref:ABC transporter permease n=1 Tax=Halocella sp. SP3-1 TaxID=2382161 RepID=UPI000F759E3A|nr:ABC transporter permease [Halocella sp. SP3-1]AZO94691.1 ABC transporter permease [Halocella sp. SP3-1]MTI58413.1 ABC transporter permease [Bacillota bacterium]